MLKKIVSPHRIASVALVLIGACILWLAAAQQSPDAARAAKSHPIRCGVYSVRSGEPHTCIVFQCDRADEGIRSNCEKFIIPPNPALNELGEASATHRYEIETCILSPNGNANNCDVSFTPKGGQIIARH